MPRRRRRRLALALATTLATLALAAGVARDVRAQQRPAPRAVSGLAEPVLLEVRLGQAAALAVAGERLGSRVWLPAATLLEAMELQVVERTASRTVAVRWPEGTRLVLDADSMRVRANARPLDLPSLALAPSPDGVLVDVKVLAALLAVPLELSFGEAVLSFPDVQALPIGRRVAREQAHARFREGEQATLGPSNTVAPLARPWADGAVVDYSLSMPLGGAITRPGWNTGLGLDVLGGSFEMTAGATAGGVRLPTLASWTGVWRTGARLAQLRIGDGTSAGPRPRLGRGVMLTNAPYMRPALFGLQTVRGSLPPGWAIEAYRNGQLVAVDTVGRDASWALRVPLLYGENPIDLLAVGPFGQTRALSQATRVGMDLLPAGRGEYAVGAAQCQLRQQCTTTASADYRLGLTAQWTARAGVEALARDPVRWRAAPYAALSGTPLPYLGVQGEVAPNSHARVAMNLEPSNRARLAVEHQWFARDPIDPLLAGRRLGQTSVYGLWRRFTPAQPTVEASLDRAMFTDGGALVRARLMAGAQASWLRAQGYLRLDQLGRGAPLARLAGTELQLLPDGRRGRWLGAAFTRLVAEVDERARPWRTALTTAMPLPGAFRVDAGVAWQRGTRGGLFTLMLARDLDVIRSYTSATAGAGGTSSTQSVQGSLLVHRREGRPVLVPGPSLQRAGVAGVVFLDRDANGVRDAGEPAVGGVRIQVGAGFGIADSLGRYRIWDLVPYVPLPIDVDASTVPSPLWIPALPHREIEIGPNRFEPVDVPLVPGGSVDGRVIDDAGRAIGAVPVVLRDARGRVLARTTTFADGAWLADGVRPGRVTAHVDSAWLAERGGATATVATGELAASDEGASARVRDVVVTWPRAQRAPSPPAEAVVAVADTAPPRLAGASTTGATESVSSPSVERSSTRSVRAVSASRPSRASAASSRRTRTSRAVQAPDASRGRSAAARRTLPSNTTSRAAPQPRARTKSVQPLPSRKAATPSSAVGAGRTRASTAIVAPCCAATRRGAATASPKARSGATARPTRRGGAAARVQPTSGRGGRALMRGDIGTVGTRHEETSVAPRTAPPGQAARPVATIAQALAPQRRGCEYDEADVAPIVSPAPRVVARLPRGAAGH